MKIIPVLFLSGLATLSSVTFAQTKTTAETQDIVVTQAPAIETTDTTTTTTETQPTAVEIQADTEQPASEASAAE